MHLLSRFRKRADPAVTVAPQAPFYAVGDIHGRADLLEAMVALIAADGGAAAQMVFVGDYIDRGDDSAAVLTRLQALNAAGQCICLAGNHEKMLLEFLDAPEELGRRWLRNGGLQTLASFGIGGLSEADGPDRLRTVSDAFRAVIDPDLVHWLRQLPLIWQSGNIAVVHAALDPDTAVAATPEHTAIWGDPRFFSHPRRDGVWVVHGHTIVDSAAAAGGIISIDTGAVFTGRLTAAAIETGAVRFLET